MNTAEFIVPVCHQSVRILHADDELLFVDKPAGLLSVPGRHPANRDSVISRIHEQYPEARIVHRLDMATSGVMVLALSDQSHRELSRQFEQRQVSKTYEACVYGLPEATEDCIDLPISCDWPNRPRQQIDPVNGKPALTRYRLLESDGRRSRLELRPVTGRSHQLRIHLAAIGHPILGCEFYAHDEARRMAERLLLHATQLVVSHPTKGEIIEINCPVPF